MDAEFERLATLAQLAYARGDFESCVMYQRAAIRRGDEVLAAGGSDLKFAPIVDAFESLVRGDIA